MDCRRRIAAGLVVLGFWIMPANRTALAQGPPLDYPFPTLIYTAKHQRTNVATPHTDHQAGHPQMVSSMAHPSYNEHYTGGFIGGGKATGGHDRCLNEGTWGWDYAPFRTSSSHIFLNWSHGKRIQGGTRGYATDGPKPLEHIKETVHEHLGQE